MKLLWRLGKEAIKYKTYYIIALISTSILTFLNLFSPRLLSDMTGIVAAGVTEEGLNEILRLTVFLTLIYLSRILFRFFSNYFAHVAAWNLVEKTRVRVYDKIQSLSMGFFHNRQIGDLMSRVVNDAANLENLYAHIIPESIINFMTIIGVMVILITINVKLALLTCIPIPFILAAGWIFAKRVRPKFRLAQKAIADINSKLQDNFSGIHEIQAFNKEKYETKEVGIKAHAHTFSILRALKQSGVFHPTVEFFSSAGTIIVVGVGGVLAFHNELSVADIVAFLLYLSLFYAPIASIARLLEDMQTSYAGAERVAAILDEEQEIFDEEDAQPLENIKGSIEFKNVNFNYNEESPVLKNISFKCGAGDMVALVGPTGVGKTTVTQLVSRFYDPTAGQVLIDGRDIKHVKLESLRQNIAPVLQDTFLFNGTIAENIAYSVTTAEIEDIIAAARAAKIHDSIMEMPDQYNTRVGERGLRLSGGQKQRIAIARAILRGSPIIILDEATASVDVETEKEIQNAIYELMGKKTIIAIAHRLSTIKHADMILVLEEGEIVQRGTHKELLEQEGLYKKLYDMGIAEC